MGWLCSQCGTENRFRETRCRACLSRGSLKNRAIGFGITLYERLSADRLGGFAETVHDKIRKGVGGVNRVVGIGMAIGVVCGAIMLLLMSSGIAESKLPMQRVHQLGGRIVQRLDRAAQTLADKGTRFSVCADEWGKVLNGIPQRIGTRAESAATAAAGWGYRLEHSSEELGRKSLMLNRQIQHAADRLTMLGQQTVSEIPRMHIHCVRWLSYRLNDMERWIAAEQIHWLDGAAQWIWSVRNELWQLANEWD